MNPHHLGMDDRLAGMCVYCGATPHTRDHVPSKVFIDVPYPAQLPVVNACENCNAGFSLDEQYLSCFVECVIAGTTAPSCQRRPKTERILAENPALRRRIKKSQRKDADGNLLWDPEPSRIRAIVMKLARGHAAFELYPKLEEPDSVEIVPLQTMSERERSLYEGVATEGVTGWPEINSRLFHRVADDSSFGSLEEGEWIIVQPDRYRYSVEEFRGVRIRMVISEYLACSVTWDEDSEKAIDLFPKVVLNYEI